MISIWNGGLLYQTSGNVGTLKTLVKIAYDVCSIQELLQKELNYIEKVFRVNSNYPIWES